MRYVYVFIKLHIDSMELSCDIDYSYFSFLLLYLHAILYCRNGIRLIFCSISQIVTAIKFAVRHRLSYYME